ncbi:MAG: hypothetical protein QOG45_2211 [Chloroflexota bacterium]|nr:hypothetical protein [Chloroflexota bacterium]
MIAGGVSSPKVVAFGLLGLFSLVVLIVLVRVDWISVIDRVRAWDARRRGRAGAPVDPRADPGALLPNGTSCRNGRGGPAAALAHRPVVR